MPDCSLEDKTKGTHNPATIKVATVKGVLFLCAKCAMMVAGVGGGAFAVFRATQQ